MTLANRTIAGAAWKLAEQMARQGVGAAVALLLAYFLTPADFGLVAMMTIFLAVGASLMESGLGDALIRLHPATDEDLNTAFFTNIVLGAIAYSLLFALAPVIAEFYELAELTLLIRVAGVGILINSLQVVQNACFIRALNFKAQLKAALPASVIAGATAVVLASLGLGVWAPIAQMLFYALINTVILWRTSSWKPSKTFCIESFRRLYRFGWKLFLSGLIDTAFKNIYVVVIAKVFSSSLVGLYVFAEKIRDLVLLQLMTSIQSATFPALATLQHDLPRLKDAYRRIVAITSFVLFPCCVILAAFAEPLFAILLPDRWHEAIVYLQLMCITALLYPLHAINLNILKVLGRSDIFLKLEILKKIILVVVLRISINYGIAGILIGQIINTLLAFIPNCYFSARLINYAISQQVLDFLPYLVLALAIGGGAHWLTSLNVWPNWAALLVLMPTALALYFGAAWMLNLKAPVMLAAMVRQRTGRLGIR